MSNIKAFIHGIYPRSNILAQTTRDFDRKRVTLADVKKQQKKDGADLEKVQKEAKLDYYEDGKLAWQDIFRPLVEATNGMEVGALTRWFDNNSFYRQPIINGKLKLSPKNLDDYFVNQPENKWKVSLPSPFTLAKVSEDTTTASFEETLASITQVYSDLFSYLTKRKVAFIQLNEPYIPYHKVKKTEIVLLAKALLQLKKAKGNAILAVNGYFGDTALLVSALSGNTAVDILGIDFFYTALSTLPKEIPHDIIAGVVDGRNSLMEEKATIKAFVQKASKQFGKRTIYLSNNSDLDLLPEEVAKKKVALLGEIAKKFK